MNKEKSKTPPQGSKKAASMAGRLVGRLADSVTDSVTLGWLVFVVRSEILRGSFFGWCKLPAGLGWLDLRCGTQAEHF